MATRRFSPLNVSGSFTDVVGGGRGNCDADVVSGVPMGHQAVADLANAPEKASVSKRNARHLALNWVVHHDQRPGMRELRARVRAACWVDQRPAASRSASQHGSRVDGC